METFILEWPSQALTLLPGETTLMECTLPHLPMAQGKERWEESESDWSVSLEEQRKV
jgi:hypothetical protein